MPTEITKKFWVTFDGKECPTHKEAETWEAANFHARLVRLDATDVQAAVALDPRVEAITAAIELAALEIKRNRRKVEAPPPPPEDP